MKITDKTPLVDEKGNLGFMQRVQGMLEYGFNWPRELEAQSAIIKFFERELGKNYNLIRNMTLGQSGIMIPVILVGSAGIFVIEVTHLRGRYEANGETWNVEAGDSYKPAPVNLIKETMRKARALDAFITRQGVRLPVEIEPIIIAADPGLHIQSSSPAIKVMMVDGIRTFVAGLAVVNSAALNSMQINDLTDRILNPRSKMEAPPPELEPEPEFDPAARWQENYESAQPFQPSEPEPVFFQQQEPSRASAIFDAQPQEDLFSFNPNDVGFALGNENEVLDIPQVVRVEPEFVPEEPSRNVQPKQQLMMGMTSTQLMVLGGLALALVCILAIFAYVAFVLK